MNIRIGRICAIAGLAGAALALSPAYAGEAVLHSFVGPPGDGQSSYAGVVMDSSGNFYGTSAYGGSKKAGTVFEITSAGSYSVIWSFGGTGDGRNPFAALIVDSHGSLYGTTEYGGAHGVGTVFELSRSGSTWSEKVVYSFNTPATQDGRNPLGRMLIDSGGHLYGTTLLGGAHNLGTVFKLSRSGGTWSETRLHDFAGSPADGYGPYAGLVMGSGGFLYGTTYHGGANNSGAAYKVKNDGTSFTVIHSFGGIGDGRSPRGELVLDGNGNLYGTTAGGSTYGWGAVFEVSSSGSYSQIHAFGQRTDGITPYAGLIMDAGGNLYGTTTGGGGICNCGIVFELAAGTWSESILYNFAGFGVKDGQQPECTLVMNSSGHLYGTTIGGGTNNLGVVFQVN
jgi:uncharacterized repeat protein (TIGR03803 family)